MPFATHTLLGLLAVLGGSNVANAVCTGLSLGIGTPVASTATGLTQCTYTLLHWRRHGLADTKILDKIYDTSCNTLQTLSISTTIGVCDTRYFLCNFGTTTIRAYDDPTSGISYLCSADATSESCSSDTLTYCVSPYCPCVHNYLREQRFTDYVYCIVLCWYCCGFLVTPRVEERLRSWKDAGVLYF